VVQPPLPPLAPTARDLMKEWKVFIPLRMGGGAAANLLEAGGTDVVPVVDSDGRCVGLFSASKYRRHSGRTGPDGGLALVGQIVRPAGTADEVRYHMARRFTVATPEASVQELRRLLSTAADPFFVVLDYQWRPRGVVCGLDVVVAESKACGLAGTTAPPALTAPHPRGLI
jgi:CBS domain-containing protein